MNDKEKIAALRECVEWLSVHLKRDHKCLHMESDRKGIDLWIKQTLAATVPDQSEASEAEAMLAHAQAYGWPAKWQTPDGIKFGYLEQWEGFSEPLDAIRAAMKGAGS